jgi:hypothetical protein
LLLATVEACPAMAEHGIREDQLKGIKNRLLYSPDENHWILKPKCRSLCQKEFFKCSAKPSKP